jgi:hypothetical protein
MSKNIQKLIIIIVFFIWSYSFSHLIHTGTMKPSDKCPYEKSSYELCEIILHTQEAKVQSKISILLILTLPTLILLTKIRIIKVISKISKITQNFSPIIFEELFSKGILNRKAP